MENELTNLEYNNFIVDIKNKIRSSQYEAMKMLKDFLQVIYGECVIFI